MSYIKRESAIKAIENDCSEAVYYTKRDAIDCLLAEPTADVVEVVRCKDCKRLGVCGTNLFYLKDPNSFCSCGERREK